MPSPKDDWDSEGLWAAYAPSDKAPWNLVRVVHLYRGAGFAATAAELQRDLMGGPAKSIGRLLNGRIREAVPNNFARSPINPPGAAEAEAVG